MKGKWVDRPGDHMGHTRHRTVELRPEERARPVSLANYLRALDPALPPCEDQVREMLAAYEKLMAERGLGSAPADPLSEDALIVKVRDLCAFFLRTRSIEKRLQAMWQLGVTHTMLVLRHGHLRNSKTGKSINDPLDEKRSKRNAREKARAAKDYIAWQAEADKIWSKHPRRSKSAVADVVKARLKSPQKSETIADKLKKPPIAG